MYGITSKSQIIDLDTIKAGCQEFKDCLDDFEICGKGVIEAGETCNSKALSVDEKTFEYPITDLGESIKALKDEYIGYADQVIADATSVYNAQIAEYNDYVTKMQQQENQNNG